MKITASAPNKVHLAGEHSVVYGGWALMSPVEVNGNRNKINLVVAAAAAGMEEFVFSGDLGTTKMAADGALSGDERYNAMFEAVKVVFAKQGFKLAGSGKSFKATMAYSGAPKGTGNSASIPAALAAALYSYFGAKPSKTDLFDAAYAVDNIYHGGKSSGGDPRAVVSDNPLLFRKVFGAGGKVTFEYADAKLSLPSGSALLLIDSYRSGEKGNTGALVALFAKNHGITKPPVEMTSAEREKVTKPFDEVVKKIASECQAKGDAAKLGGLLEANHELLRKGGVVTPDLDECLKIARQNGSYGGKGIGALGNGGAAIALCPAVKVKQIEAALKKEGFAAYEISFASRGAGVD